MGDYSLGWGSQHPGHLVCLVDLSGSMGTDNKIGRVMDALQKSMRSLVTKCIQGTGLVERFTVTIIGYHSHIIPLFSGGVQELQSLIKKAVSTQKPLFDYEEGGVAEPMGQTYMSNAFNAARKDIEQWISSSNSNGHPAPVVINITDGQPEEQDKTLETCANEALQAARKLTSVRTPDGNVLLYNLHIGSSENTNQIVLPVERPSTTGNQREDQRVGFLYDSASVLTEEIVKHAAGYDFPIQAGSRGMASNVQDSALLTKLIEFSSSLTTNIGRETPIP